MASKMTKRIGKSGKTTWTCLVDLPADPVTGKRRQKRLSAPTKKELETLVTETMHAVNTSDYIEPSKVTVAAHLDAWLTARESTVRPATMHVYRRTVKHMTVTLGHVQLARLTPAAVQAYYATRLAVGAAPSTVRMEHVALRSALALAVIWRMLPRNPCDGVTPPRAPAPELTTWTADQARTFLAGTADHELGALFRLALTTGMRRGELLALRWQDVDMRRGALAVTRTVTYDANGKATVGEPKSASGRRAIALPPACVAALKLHRVRQNERRLQWGDAWQDTGLVFDRGNGAPLSLMVLRETFKRAIERLGLPDIRLHDLRHTAATLALAEGIHPKIVQERLGHSNVAITLDRYSHVSMDMQRDAAERLERALGG